MPTLLDAPWEDTERVKGEQEQPWERGKRDHVFVPWETVQIVCGSGLEFSCERVTIWQAFSEMEFRLRQLPEEGALKWNFPPSISRRMPGVEVKPPN